MSFLPEYKAKNAPKMPQTSFDTLHKFERFQQRVSGIEDKACSSDRIPPIFLYFTELSFKLLLSAESFDSTSFLSNKVTQNPENDLFW